MSDMNKKLTVSLLSSGRQGTIERCLESLDGLKAMIDTEVVVIDTDTSGNEEVRKIIEKYADKIEPFEWCNDFAKARNAQLEASGGEWFLYLDDDEWLIDAAPIAAFIEDDRADAAHIRIYNYDTPAFTTHSDTWGTRLFKRGDGVRFEGVIHEYPTLMSEAAACEAIIGHSGYAFADEEERMAHSKRNITLLKGALEDEPMNLRWLMQLLTEYANIGDVEAQRRICDDVISQAGAAAMDGLFAAARIRIEQKAENWQEAASLLDRYIHVNGYSDTACAYMRYEACVVYYNLQDFQRAYTYAAQYLDTYDPSKKSLPASYFLVETYDDSVFSMVTVLGIASEVKTKETWTLFDKYYESVDWSGNSGFEVRGYCGILLALMAEVDYDERFAKMVSSFWAQPSTRQVVKMALKGMGISELGGRWNLVHAISKADITEDTPWDILLLDEVHTRELDDVANRIPFSEFKEMTNALAMGIDSDTLAAMEGYFDEVESVDDMKRFYFIAVARLWNLIRWDAADKTPVAGSASAGKRLQWLEDELTAVRVNLLNFYGRLYTEDALNNRQDELESEAHLAVKLRMMADIPAKNHKEMLMHLKSMFGIYPAADSLLHRYSNLYAEWRKGVAASEAAKDSPVNEMQQLIDALQQKVEQLVSAGMIEEAQQIMKEIEKFRI